MPKLKARSRLARTSRKGSMVLALLFSTIAGLGFTLLFVNLAQFVGATDAVEQAARSVARCLTPTDPECASYSGEPVNVALHWFGENSGPGAPNVTLEPFRYDATMFLEDWEMRYRTYESHLVTPVLGNTHYEVARRRFVRPYNTHEEIYARVRGTAVRNDTFRPVTDYPFPHVDPATERNHLSIASWDNLGPYCMARSAGGRCCTNPNNSACRVVRRIDLSEVTRQRTWGNLSSTLVTLDAGNNTRVFNTGLRWRVPEVPGGSASASCQDRYGRDCGNLIQGAAGGTANWWARAHIAIKVQARVCDGGNGEVGWLGGQPGESSFYLDIEGRPSIPLGGVDRRGLGSTCQWLTSWLRGPVGSTGGPGSSYAGITVPRGSRIGVRARMRRTAGTVDVRYVRVKVFWDSYEAGDQAPLVLDCTGEYRQYPPLGDAEGPATPQDCVEASSPQLQGNDLSTLTWLGANPLRIINGSLRHVPTCNSDPTQVFAVDPAFASGATKDVAVCNTHWLPTNLEVPAEPGNRLFCGHWQHSGTDLGWQKVAALPVGQCTPDDQSVVRVITDGGLQCASPQLFQDDGSYDYAPGCDATAAQSVIDAINASTNSVNAAQPPEEPAVTFPASFSLANFAWQPALGDSSAWNFSWNNPSESGNLCSCPTRDSAGCSQEACYNDNAVANSSNIYQRNAGVWSPDASFFPGLASQHPGQGAPPGGVPDRLQFVNVTTTPQALDIEAGIFDGRKTYDFHWGDEADANRYDYNLDCRNDYDCPYAHTDHETEEDAMRAIASEQVPEALDPQVVFNYTKEPFDPNARFEEYPGEEVASLSLPNCTKAAVVCTYPHRERSYLGEFSSVDFPQGPAECRDGSYDTCSSTLAQTTFEDSGADYQVDYTEALERGLSEIARFNPEFNSVTHYGCSGPGCASIEIDATSGPQALVTVRYNLPVTTPLREFIGQDYLTIEHTVEHVKELDMVGRS